MQRPRRAADLVLWGWVVHLLADWILQDEWQAQHKMPLQDCGATSEDIVAPRRCAAYRTILALCPGAGEGVDERFGGSYDVGVMAAGSGKPPGPSNVGATVLLANTRPA
jgi:hypothetical protein